MVKTLIRYLQRRKEGNVLFNNVLNTFYLRWYGIRHMVKDHSDKEKGNMQPPHRQLFLIKQGFFYMHHSRQDSTYHDLCYTSRGALVGIRNSSMGPPHEGSIRRPIASWANALTTQLHLTPIYKEDSVCQNKTCQPVTLYCHPNFIVTPMVSVFAHGGMDHSLMLGWIVGLILHGGPIELFLVPASAPRLV